MTTRRCKNWLESFLEWTLPRSESKEILLKWSGLFALSATVARKAVLDPDYLGGWSVAPTMYVVFVGPQGVIRKSTTIGFAEKLLEQNPKLTKAPEIFTSPIIIEKLTESHDGSVFIIAGEFGTLMEKDEKLYITLTNLFDHKSKVDEQTVGRGYKLAEKPGVSMLGATTPDWINMHMSEAVLGTGFGSRVIYIFESGVRQRRLIYKGKFDPKRTAKLEEDLVHDLIHIYETCQGTVEMDDETADYLDQWYQENCDPPHGEIAQMLGFYQRRPAHVIKAAILCHIAWADDLILTKKDIDDGVKLIDEIIPNVRRTFKNIGKHNMIADMNNIHEYVKENGQVEHAEILRVFQSAALPSDLEAMIQGLLNSMMLECKMIKARPWYTAVEY